MNQKCNIEIRVALKQAHMAQWQLADLLEIPEGTLSRKFRKELPEEEKESIIELIWKHRGVKE